MLWPLPGHVLGLSSIKNKKKKKKKKGASGSPARAAVIATIGIPTPGSGQFQLSEIQCSGAASRGSTPGPAQSEDARTRDGRRRSAVGVAIGAVPRTGTCPRNGLHGRPASTRSIRLARLAPGSRASAARSRSPAPLDEPKLSCACGLRKDLLCALQRLPSTYRFVASSNVATTPDDAPPKRRPLRRSSVARPRARGGPARIETVRCCQTGTARRKRLFGAARVRHLRPAAPAYPGGAPSRSPAHDRLIVSRLFRQRQPIPQPNCAACHHCLSDELAPALLTVRAVSAAVAPEHWIAVMYGESNDGRSSPAARILAPGKSIRRCTARAFQCSRAARAPPRARQRIELGARSPAPTRASRLSDGFSIYRCVPGLKRAGRRPRAARGRRRVEPARESAPNRRGCSERDVRSGRILGRIAWPFRTGSAARSRCARDAEGRTTRASVRTSRTRMQSVSASTVLALSRNRSRARLPQVEPLLVQ